MPRNKEKPAFKDVRFEVRKRLAARPSVEVFCDAASRPVRLRGFKDGDYVRLDPPRFPPWENCLPGGRVEKTESLDSIIDIPLAVTWSGCSYHLAGCSVKPQDLRHIHLMNDTQREAWIRQMERLQAQGEFSKFRRPRAHKRGGDPAALADLF